MRRRQQGRHQSQKELTAFGSGYCIDFPTHKGNPRTPNEAFGIAAELTREDQTRIIDIAEELGSGALKRYGISSPNDFDIKHRPHVTLLPRGYLSNAMWDLTHDQGIGIDYGRFSGFRELMPRVTRELGTHFRTARIPDVEISSIGWSGEHDNVLVGRLDANNAAYKQLLSIQRTALRAIERFSHRLTETEPNKPDHITIMRTKKRLHPRDKDSIAATMHSHIVSERVAFGGLLVYAGSNRQYVN